MKNTKGIMMENTHEVDDGSLKGNKRLSSELARSEIAKCDESRDIRDKVIGGEPFASSAQKRQKAEKTAIKGEFGEAQSDGDLHSDTTTPRENKIGKAPQAKNTFTSSAKERQTAEHTGASREVKEINRNSQTHS